jgi:hypothetical protein
VAYAAICAAIDPLEAAEPDRETPIPGFGDKSYPAGAFLASKRVRACSARAGDNAEIVAIFLSSAA